MLLTAASSKMNWDGRPGILLNQDSERRFNGIWTIRSGYKGSKVVNTDRGLGCITVIHRLVPSRFQSDSDRLLSVVSCLLFVANGSSPAGCQAETDSLTVQDKYTSRIQL